MLYLPFHFVLYLPQHIGYRIKDAIIQDKIEISKTIYEKDQLGNIKLHNPKETENNNDQTPSEGCGMGIALYWGARLCPFLGAGCALLPFAWGSLEE